MMVWDIRAAGQAPQHIGEYDGASPLAELLADGGKAGHGMAIAAVATGPRSTNCYTFKRAEDYDRFFGFNADLAISDESRVNVRAF